MRVLKSSSAGDIATLYHFDAMDLRYIAIRPDTVDVSGVKLALDYSQSKNHP